MGLDADIYVRLAWLLVIGAVAGIGYTMTTDKHPNIALAFALLALAVIILAGK